MKPLILASTSKYRAQLLERLGFAYTALAPTYIEVNDPSVEPALLVAQQARAKAESLVEDGKDSLIIGSDQVAVLDQQVLVKPGHHEAAFEQLRAMAGHEHRLLTAVVVCDASSGDCLEHLEVTRVGIRDLSDDEIHEYLKRDQPYDCAGSYKAECSAPWIFEYQRGDDPTAVIGLPLIALGKMLRQYSAQTLNPNS